MKVGCDAILSTSVELLTCLRSQQRAYGSLRAVVIGFSSGLDDGMMTSCSNGQPPKVSNFLGNCDIKIYWHFQSIS